VHRRTFLSAATGSLLASSGMLQWGCGRAPADGKPRALRFAITDVEGLEQLQREFGEFRDLLQQKTGLKFDLFPIADRTVAVSALENDQIDLVITGPAEYVIFRSRTEVRPLIGLFRPDYTAVFLVRKADGVKSLSELRGKKVALGDVGSTSKHIAPLDMLAKAGVPHTEIEPFHTSVRSGWETLLQKNVFTFGTTKDKWLAEGGFCKEVRAIFPSVTNVNNVSICCGAWPRQHGIIGNSYFDPDANGAVYMNSADLIRCPTLFQRAAAAGLKSALLTSKRKTIELLSRETDVAIAAERPTDEWTRILGQPADIYSREINYWLWEAAVHLLKERPDINVIYVHTTDYPMHTWAPEALESQEHLQRIDQLLGQAQATAPDAAFFVTADHSMNFKTGAWDLSRVMTERGTLLKFALSPERDYYIKHHRNLAGCSYMWWNQPSDEPRICQVLESLEGVDEILSRDEAIDRFQLPPERVGDLVVLADRTTMFGDLEQPYEELPATYRNHGSLYEMRVPLMISNFKGELPPPAEFESNKDLTRFLFPLRR
jgi:phosphonoacetate hydrolase